MRLFIIISQEPVETFVVLFSDSRRDGQRIQNQEQESERVRRKRNQSLVHPLSGEWVAMDNNVDTGRRTTGRQMIRNGMVGYRYIFR